MAIQTSAIFKGFSGNINRQLLFRQCGGKTIVSKFPDRSRVIYSEKQKQERRRFADAVSFARIMIADEGLKQVYSLKALSLGFRSAWNVAIAEFMSDQPLEPKNKKIAFDRSQIRYPAQDELKIKLFKAVTEKIPVLNKIPRQRSRKRAVVNYRKDRVRLGWNVLVAGTVVGEEDYRSISAIFSQNSS